MKEMGQIIQLPNFGPIPVPGDPNVKNAGLLTVLLLPNNFLSAPLD